MKRFVVCGSHANGMVRVTDTDDWSVEFISVEQLKLLQSMGYSVGFNERFDFIFKLYNVSLIGCRDGWFSAMRDMGGFYVPYDDCRFKSGDAKRPGVVVFCFASKSEIVLFTVRCKDGVYRLTYKRNVIGELEYNISSYRARLLSMDGDNFSINYCASGDCFCGAIYDIDCNYIRSEVY